jgi:hypothetical protein
VTFCGSWISPATRTAEVGSRRRPSRAFVNMLLEEQDGNVLHEGFARWSEALMETEV